MSENGDLTGMVEGIMKNPEFAELLNEIRGKSGNGDSSKKITTEEMLSHLPDVMAMLGPIAGSATANSDEATKEEKKSEPNDFPSDKKSEDENSSVQKVSASPKKYDKKRAERLMSALKPYLNPGRCEIVDKCLSVMQLTDVVETLQGMEELTKKQ